MVDYNNTHKQTHNVILMVDYNNKHKHNVFLCVIIHHSMCVRVCIIINHEHVFVCVCYNPPWVCVFVCVIIIHHEYVCYNPP